MFFVSHLNHIKQSYKKPCMKQTVKKLDFILFFKSAEGFGEQRVPQLESAVGIHFRRGKAEVSRLLADGTSRFILLSTRQRLE